MPSDIIIHHRSNAYELFLYWSLLSYFTATAVTLAIQITTATFTTATVTIILLCY